MKKFKLFVFLLICFFSFSLRINAAGLTVSANAYTVYVGSNVNITASASGIAGKFTFKSNNLSVLSGGGEVWIENSTSTMTFKASQVGQATITVIPSPGYVAYSDGSGYYNVSKSITINVINRPVVTPKSSVNYLSSLSIDGKELNPQFNKETLEYAVELEASTTSININATPQDNKASVIGAGNRNVTEGINNIDIVVTAENGSKRTYRIKATVKEKEPIIVYIDNEPYTVIRKKEQLISSSIYYSESSVEINGEEIPAYYGEITGYTLVGLKNSEGIINLYIYDEENSTYRLYREFNFSRIVFYPLEPDPEQIPVGYFKYIIAINDMEIPCYKKSDNDNYVLLYGVNIENNNEGFYIYDSFENTIQRYGESIFDSYKEEILILKSIIFGLISIIAVILVVSALQGSLNKKNKKSKSFSFFKIKNKEEKEKIKDEKNKDKEKIKEAKLLAKELKRKEKEEKRKKRKKKTLDDTSIIDITNINIKRK